LSHFHPEVKHPDGTYPAFAPKHKIPLIGFSATFSRHDGLALGSVFERIVYHRDFLEMIKEKWCSPRSILRQEANAEVSCVIFRLCDVRFTSVRANIQLAKVTVNTKTGEFNATSLAHVINSPVINELVVKTWLDRACRSIARCLLALPFLKGSSDPKIDTHILREP
jgi:ATP-dependent helicase IRC3